MLLNLLVWIDESPWRFWALCVFAYTVVFALCFSTDAGRKFPRLQGKRWWIHVSSDAAFVGALSAMLFVFRWPVFLFPQQLNADESSFISQALTLQHDPVFWRSVVSGTSGPLNVYPRTLPGLLGLPQTFLMARIMALLCVCGSLAIFLRTCRLFSSTSISRLATLAPATFFALTTNGDFTHFSGEHVPIFLLAAASYFALRLPEAGSKSPAWAFLSGLVLGSVPFAKLQGGIVALTITGFCYWFLLTREESWTVRLRRCGWLTLGGVTIPLLVLVTAWVTGSFEHFWQSYLLMNFRYTSSGAPLWQFLGILPELHFSMPDIVAYFQKMMLLGTMSFGWIIVSGRWRTVVRQEMRVLLFFTAVLAVSLFSAVAPCRPFPHYFLFAVLPVAGWAFFLFNVCLNGPSDPPRSSNIGWIATVAWCTVGLLGQCSSYLITKQPLELRGHVREFLKIPRSEVAEVISRYCLPGQPLGLWGWMYQFNVETGTWRATSDVLLEYLWNANTEGRQVSTWLELVPQYFQDLYMADFQRSKPPVFVDAVAPTSFIFADRRMFGYETFPALAKYIDANYDLAHEINGIRIFVRKDGQGVVQPVTETLAPKTRPAGGGLSPSQTSPEQLLADAKAHHQRGLQLFSEGKLDDAIEHYQQAVALVPGLAAARQDLGTAYLRKGMNENAVSSFRIAAELQPSDPTAQSSLADGLLQAGWVEEAVTRYQAALKLDSNYVPALNNLAWILSARGDALLRDGTKAVELAEQAKQLAGNDNPVILSTLAAAYGEAGRFSEASEMAQQALNLATAQNNPALIGVIREALKCYSTGKPFRDQPIDGKRNAGGSP